MKPYPLLMATTYAAFQSLTLPFATKMQSCSRASPSALISNPISNVSNLKRPHNCYGVPKVKHFIQG